MKGKFPVLLLAIIVLAACLRLTALSKNPASLNWDEVSHGYNAYSILKTGKDEWGQLLPLTNFRAYGDYPLPLNLYITIPFISLLGLSEFSIRLPHAILGVLTVIATYYLALGITKKKKLSLLVSLLAAIGPWYLFTSRFVLQSNLSVFLLISAMAVFFHRKKKRFLLPLSIFLLGLSLFSYHTTRIVSPILLLLMFGIYRDEIVKVIKKDKLVAAAMIFFVVLFFVPLPFILSNPEARARSQQVFLVNEAAVNKIVEARQSSELPAIATKLIYNRPSYFVYEFSKNYLNYFSPDFLFFKGGTQYQFSIPGKGLLYIVNLPFFYLGLLYIFRKALKGKKKYKLILAWLLIAPIPASITLEKFAVLRSTPMLPLPELLTAIGFFAVLKRLKRFKSYIWVAYLIALVALLGSYLTTYYNSYRTDYSWAWQYGYKEVVYYAKDHYDEYDKIIVSKKYGEPHEFFLFFWSWDPEQYRNDPNLVRFYQSSWYWVDAFDKLYFVNDWEIPSEGTTFVLESKKEVDCSDANCLFITSPGNYPDGWDKLDTIKFLDDKPAFEIYEKTIK